MSNGKRAVSLAVIKQADENMDKMKQALVGTMTYFQLVYPEIDFSISRNQTELLDYTISNLQQNLSLGFLFICLVAVLFLGDVKSPLVIGLSMVVSIVISFVFFYLCNMSLNIISLAGLILALGMMIDSSIIVTENISQYRERGYSLRRACVTGRLFKEIREKRGLVYTVYSFSNSHTQSGLFGIYAGTTNKELKELMPVICEEINKICREKVSEQELNRAKTQLKASMLMALESSSSTAEVLARQMLLFDRIIPIEEMVERIEKVSVDDVQNIARKIFSSNPTYTLVGDIEGYPPYDEIKQMIKL